MTNNTILQRCHASLARFSLARASLARPSLACFTMTRSQFGAFQFDAMPVWRVPLWRVSPFCAFPLSVPFNIDENPLPYNIQVSLVRMRLDECQLDGVQQDNAAV